MKRINKQNGITLIALVITIIVMLILVSVTISMAINGNLFNYAGKGAKETEQAKQEEQELSSGRIQVDGVWYDSLQAVADGIPSENQNGAILLKNYNDTEKDDTKNGVLKANAYWIDYDEKGNEKARAVVPKGFKVIKGLNGTTTIADGLVIQDEEGNEFVWIPVKVVKEGENKDSETSIASFYRSNWSSNGRGTTKYTDKTGSSYNEPFTGGYTNEEAEYNDMLKSVYTYEGFYIGRFEAGSTVKRTSTGINEDGGNGTTKMVVKQDAYPYTYVGWGSTMSNYTNEVTYSSKKQGIGALALSKAMYANKDVGVTSTLCYGVMWDAMLDFIIKDSNYSVKNSTTWGNYTNNAWTITRTEAKYSKDNGETWEKIDDEKNDQKSKTSSESILLTTGASDSFSAKNIYDVAGNVFEWTNEADSTDGRVVRGGCYRNGGDYVPASYRSDNDPSICYDYRLGFRPALYISVGLDAKGDDLAKTTE